jgi:UDP-N-acetylmuramoylalanine--D-glutamate ligase
MAEYVHAKRNLFAHQGVDDIAVYTPLNAFSSQNVQVSPASTKIPYGAELKDVDGVRVVGEEILYGDAVVARLSDVALVGRHMLDNVCAAIAASWDYVPDKSIYPKVLRKFTGLPHRLQVVAEVNGVRYIDDSISTVPDTAMAAIRSFAEPKQLILGGSDKGNDYSDLAKLIAQDGTIKQVYLLGQTASKIAKSLQDADFDRYSDTHTELTEIVQQASKAAKQGDIVLLSPACASFDMF